ncbi:MAG: hypothetical protein K5981_06690 [Clostridia bacterium]|nr:hypothetical protein [Clostridia bacterium]
MKLKVREAEARDLPQLKRLSDDLIAVDFYSMEDLEGMLRKEDDLLCIVVDEDRNDTVASFFYAFLSTLDEALEVLHVKEKPEVLQKLDGSTRVGVYKTTATAPAYRKRGLFSAFMKDLQPVLRGRGARMILTTALHPPGREIPTLNALRSTGFVPVSTLYRPWVGKKGYCPYCGQDYCICNAEFYIREFDEKGNGELDG